MTSPRTDGAARSEQRAEGRALRDRAPLSAWAEWIPAPDRDPLARIEAQNARRLAELVPLRRVRMAASSFTFYRGAAARDGAQRARRLSTELGHVPPSQLRASGS